MTIQAGYYIVNNWVSRGTLYADGYKIQSLPAQTDMTDGRRWVRPGNDADVVRPAKLVTSPNGYRYGYGGYTFVWSMQGLSPKMVNHLFTTYFSSKYSNKLTVQTFNRATGAWECYWTIARFPDVGEEAEAALGGYNNLKLSFVTYQTAPEGPDLRLTATHSAPYVLYLPFTVTFTLTNIGDVATVEQSFVTWAVPTDMKFRSIVATGSSSVEYSTNSGASYSVSVPAEHENVTNIRITYSAGIAVSASKTISVDMYGIQNGNVSFTFISTTASDIDTSNNTYTATVSIDGRGFNQGFSSGFGKSKGFSSGFDRGWGA